MDGLAFLPQGGVSEGVSYLRTVAPAEAEELLEYFYRTYVTGSYRQQTPNINNNDPHQPQLIRLRHTPMYPPAVWNVHTATMMNNPRTNNVCESWNNKFACLVGHHHPSI